ncbi:hypothetical protein TNIN_65811 [Trichonephila inaurata madagascariensis]|uniref:Uncharacterized protein n=1 Tax=Trichonephila inaurata madagascariensis TaxID=2747483 RepID=A0A8X7CEN8_9ARAC|nr:hypothetical protein TNIN_65811 [Trichonephila inaurata madagascariensis]
MQIPAFSCRLRISQAMLRKSPPPPYVLPRGYRSQSTLVYLSYRSPDFASTHPRKQALGTVPLFACFRCMKADISTYTPAENDVIKRAST